MKSPSSGDPVLRKTVFWALAALAIACGPKPDPHAEPSDLPDPAELAGPPADFSGAWISHDAAYGAFYLSGRQKGTAFSGEMLRRDFSEESPQPPFFGLITGRVQGRVLQATWAIVKGPQRKITLTASPDGIQATLRGWGPLEMRRVFTPADNPAMQGMLASRLPFQTDGILERKKPPSNEIRESFAGLTFLPTTEPGKTEAVVLVVPLETPRRISTVRFKKSPDEPTSYLFDYEYFRESRLQSPLHAKREVLIGGSRAWWITNLAWEEDAKEPVPTVLLGELYLQDPNLETKPVDIVELARRTPTGEWHPSASYILLNQKLFRVQATFENGLPSKVDTQLIHAPALDDVLVVQDASAWRVRARNQALVLAKDRTLPRLLRDATTQEIKGLAQRVEEVTAGVEREHQGIQERVQQAPQDDVDAVKELAQAYRQRLDAVKAMLAAIQAELAKRAK
ncbi:MAG: hypothetical protein HYY16_06675 [Planctomycetes bacterium]|nr:hypothetical protein [Planctomycetota bacterium]